MIEGLELYKLWFQSPSEHVPSYRFFNIFCFLNSPLFVLTLLINNIILVKNILCYGWYNGNNLKKR